MWPFIGDPTRSRSTSCTSHSLKLLFGTTSPPEVSNSPMIRSKLAAAVDLDCGEVCGDPEPPRPRSLLLTSGLCDIGASDSFRASPSAKTVSRRDRERCSRFTFVLWRRLECRPPLPVGVESGEEGRSERENVIVALSTRGGVAGGVSNPPIFLGIVTV
jgi:hypothetical protein